MGGGIPKEKLLIILPFPEDRSITDKIREKFPNIDVRYFQLKQLKLSFESEQDLFKDTNILVTFGTFPSSPKDAPNLNLIHLLSAGIDHLVSHPLFTETNIPITTSSGIHGPTISEWVLMSTLVLSKSYKKLYELQKQHKWGRPFKDFPQSGDWVGKKVGIAGYGSIGRQIARTLTSLGCQIYAYTSTPRPDPSSRSDLHHYHLPNLGDPDGTLPLAWYSGTTEPDLHTFLSQDLDILIISLPLTPQTRHLFGEEEFNILSRRPTHQHSSTTANFPPAKPGALIINISRGAIIHQPSLISALKSHALAGAALDVTDPEPLPPDSELWEMENVVLTPHMSALTSEYLDRAVGGVLVENLGRRERGEELWNLVDRRKGY